jgi:uridylate kinase
MLKKENIIIISLGGSIIYDKKGLNVNFLRKFDHFIRKQVKAGKRFLIVCGGGLVCRKYQTASRAVIGTISSYDIDWVGIQATRINAHLLRTIFKDIAAPRIINEYSYKQTVGDWPIIICSGWKPGWSTDYDAVLLARDFGAKIILNLSNIDMVYDKNPSKYPDAKPVLKTNWGYFRRLVGDKWEPGLNVPFDPVASKLAEKLGLVVIIVRGDDFTNLEKIFADKKFKGTVIGPS